MAGGRIPVNVFVALMIRGCWSISAAADDTNKTSSNLLADHCKNVVENCFCRDKVVSCKGARFKDLNEVSSYIKYTTTRISITSGHLTEFSGFEIQLDNLVYLNLSGNAISMVDINTFRSMPYLNVIDLSNNPVRCIGEVFQPLVNLRELYMHNCNAPDDQGKVCMPETMVPNATNLTFLEVLDLGSNHFDTATDEFRAFLCNRAYNVKTLVLANNTFQHLPVDICMTSLELLDLSFNNIHTLDTNETECLESIERLEQVRLEGNPFDCTCQIAGFASWLNTTQQPLDVNSIKCAVGVNKTCAGKRLVDLDAGVLCGEPSIAVCFGGTNDEHTVHLRSIYAIVAGVAFVVSIMIVSVALMIHKRRRAKRTVRKRGNENAYYYASEPSYNRIH